MNNENEKYAIPAVRMDEQPEGYTFKFIVPGVGKNDADLHIEGRTLSLKTHAPWQQPAGFREASVEFTRDNYAVSVDLPEMADASTLKARLENGILEVSIMKRPETQPRKITIG